ncbi:hypothetical protein V6U81_14530 [Micromonospora sp. CPCC 205711]|uniref:hypothetical protein n=1 Tax=Micromonospora sp. CPCC 205547 TaxID=3122400 RepID=UPI002FF0C628
MRALQRLTASAALALVAACGSSPAPTPSGGHNHAAPSAVTVGVRSTCTPAEAKLTWSNVSRAKTLTNVFVRDGDAASRTVLVHSEGPIKPQVSDPSLSSTDWLTTLVESLSEARQVPVELAPPPEDEADLAKATLLENKQAGRLVAYSGLEKIKASFTVFCPAPNGGTKVSGELSSWAVPTTGILHCSITSGATTFGHLARKYCGRL